MIKQFKSLSPAKQRKIIVIGVVALLVTMSFVVTKLSRREPLSGVKTDTEVDVMLPKKKDTTLEGLAAQVLAMEKRMQELDRYMKSVEPNLKEAIQQKMTQMQEKQLSDEENRLKTLEGKIEALTKQLQEGGLPAGGGASVPVKAPPVIVTPPAPPQALSAQGTEEEEEAVPAGELRVIGEEKKDEKQEGGKSKKEISRADSSYGGVSDRDMRGEEEVDEEKEAFIPSGSIIQGVLLSGLDAPTGSKAAKNPVPALVRIKHDAILPNRFAQDVKECFVIVSGHGSLSTERANLRSERLSCVRPDGGVIETSLDGWVIGEDGKAGMRGRLVSKQGRVIANSLIAGVLSGLAGSFQPKTVPMLNITPGSTMQYQYPTPEGVLSGAGLGGANKALERIAEYYLEMADEIFPIIEIDAGRKMTIVLVRGTKLKML